MRLMFAKRLGWVAGACLCASLAEGATDGSFKYYGYDIYFHGSTLGSNGETKTVLSEAIDVTVSPSNTFTAAIDDYSLSRSITNHPVVSGGPVSDIRLYNAYTVSLEPEASLITGTHAVTSNLLFSLTPEGDGPIPFYFNTTTNVALTLSESSASLGAGVLVRKGAGMNAASVSGTFVRYTLGNVFQDPEMYGWGSAEKLYLEQGTMAFNGTGDYTETVTGWSNARKATERGVNYDGQIVIDTFFSLLPPVEESFSDGSTYAVQPDGTLTLSTGGGDVTCQVSPDGNLVASSMCGSGGSYEAGAYLTVAVKQPQDMPTNAVEAVYLIVGFGEYFDGYSPDAGIGNNRVETERSYVCLHADNTFSIRSDHWAVDNQMTNAHFHINGDPVSANLFTTGAGPRAVKLRGGTYSIAPNGGMTLAFRGGEPVQGQLSANGEYFVFGESQAELYYEGHALYVGVRRAPPPPAGNVAFGTPGASETGIQMTVAVPTNHPVEILSTDDLTSGEWRSSGVFTSATGVLQFNDADAVNAPRRFYIATFAPW